MKRPTKIECELATARAQIANLQDTVKDRQRELDAYYADKQSLANQVYELTSERDYHKDQVVKMKEIIINREAHIGRLCINQGVIR